MNLTKSSILIIIGVLGCMLYWILPGFFKIFAFLIPALGLSYVFSKAGGINWYILLALSFLFVLFPSSLFTLDASNPFDIYATSNYINNIVSVVVSIFVIIIPICGLVAGIYGLIKGDVEKGTNLIIKVILGIIIAGIMLFFGSMLGWNLMGLDMFKTLADVFWNIIKDVSNFFTQDIGKFLGYKDDELADLKLQDDLELLSAINTPARFWLTVESIYPVILGSISIVIGIMYKLAKTEPKGFQDDESSRFSRPLELNLSFVAFLVVILVVAFALYLTFSFDSFLNYQNVGFFGIYLTITSVSCIFLSIGIGSPTNLGRNTIFGIIFGVTFLMLYMNMFVQVRTLDLISTEYPRVLASNILNQFLFVAPTESLLFHVFLPSLVIFYYLRKNRVYSQSELEIKRITLENQIESKKLVADAQKEMRDSRRYAKNIQDIDKLMKEKAQLVNQQPGVTVNKLSDQNFMVFLCYCVLFNLIFACLHWFKSGLSFEIFWSSGLGFLYLSSGMILTLISYKFGWLSGVLCHGIHNSITLFLVMV